MASSAAGVAVLQGAYEKPVGVRACNAFGPITFLAEGGYDPALIGVRLPFAGAALGVTLDADVVFQGGAVLVTDISVRRVLIVAVALASLSQWSRLNENLRVLVGAVQLYRNRRTPAGEAEVGERRVTSEARVRAGKFWLEGVSISRAGVNRV